MLAQSPPTTSLYDRDYALWLETTIEQLRQQKFDQVDWENVLDEFEAMSKRDQRSIKSNLVIVLMHLLKWEFQPGMRSSSWSGTIIEHRQRLQDLLDDSPSLRNHLPEVISLAYSNAIVRASNETGLDISVFPIECPYDILEILNLDFLPSSNESC
jgi:Domain of unknown function DUF29